MSSNNEKFSHHIKTKEMSNEKLVELLLEGNSKIKDMKTNQIDDFYHCFYYYFESEVDQRPMVTLSYCAEYNVQLSTEKTKLLVYSPSSAKSYVDYCKLISPISIHGTPVEFSESTEHVGIIRSPSGNLPHILQRITKHQKALASVLFAGLGRNHRGNPAASLRVESIYALPVLLSGVAALILLKSELDTLAQHYKTTIQNLQKLHPKTPRPVLFFLLAHSQLKQFSTANSSHYSL